MASSVSARLVPNDDALHFSPLIHGSTVTYSTAGYADSTKAEHQKVPHTIEPSEDPQTIESPPAPQTIESPEAPHTIDAPHTIESSRRTLESLGPTNVIPLAAATSPAICVGPSDPPF